MSKLARWVSACVLLCVAISGAQETSPKPAANDGMQLDGLFRSSVTAGLEEAYLGKLFRISHAANLVKLKNGDLLCFWFSGTGEGESNVAIVMSRLSKGSEQWSKTVEIDHQTGKSFQNPVGFQLPGGHLWLLHTSQPAGEGQTNAEVLYLTSVDNGQNWSPPRPLFTQQGSFVRQPPVLLSKKMWLLPMYYTPSRTITEGAESHYSVVKTTNDGGRHWNECRIPGSNGMVQQSVVRLGAGQFLGLFRSRYADFIYQSTSHDGCSWTVPAPTRLPNNNSSVQMTLLKDKSLVPGISLGPARANHFRSHFPKMVVQRGRGFTISRRVAQIAPKMIPSAGQETRIIRILRFWRVQRERSTWRIRTAGRRSRWYGSIKTGLRMAERPEYSTAAARDKAVLERHVQRIGLPSIQP
jgi:hypothetical protein